MTTHLAERVEGVGDAVRDSPWPERIGRVGLCARGVMYAVVSVIAVQVAFGKRGNEIDRRGALRAVADQPLGKALLALLAAGFAAYAVWRLVRAAIGARGRSRRNDKATRLADLGRVVVYLSLSYTTVRFVTVNRPGRGSDAQARDWSARLMHHGYGRWLVVGAGLALVVTGAVLFVRAVGQHLEHHFERDRTPAWVCRWAPRVGAVGYVARGVVAGLVGGFIIRAGVTYDPTQAVGIDGALKRLAGRAYGPALLCAVAAGLLAFALYSFAEARWRGMLDEG